MSEPSFVLVGAGQCAASAVAALRSGGFGGTITMIGTEPDLPYERPPLSKDYLLGKADANELQIRDATWYADNQVNVHTGTTVTALDPVRHMVQLDNGDSLAYDKVLIATGGRPRVLADLDSARLRYLRSRADADQLATDLQAGGSLLILGGGFIGCEVAAAARAVGVDVTVLETADTPLQAVLGARVGARIADMHRAAGVTLRTGETVLSVTETAAGLRVRTDRAELECSRLLVAIGLVPNAEFLNGSGLDLDNGIVVDEFCATNANDIYAAGDVASHFHPVFDAHIRVEHYDNALKQGKAAAASMLGHGEPFTDPHWFWSDQYEHNLQSVGITRGYDEIVIRGSVDDLSYSAFYLRDGILRSVFAFNRAKDVSVGRRLVAARFAPDVNQLRDESVDLRRLLTAERNTR